MNFRKLVAISTASLGLFLIFISIYPILVYEWQSELKYPTLLSPLSFEESERYRFSKKDFTKAQNWFDVDKKDIATGGGILYYTLSVPKLKIDNAIVRTDSQDLSQSLVQYPGSSVPGIRGNTVIFGHSVLPVFFNPKSYITIFSTLYRLDKGDEIIVNYGDVTYRYLVDSMFEVRPSDVEVLEQNSDTSYLSLITCTPPGDPRKPKRLVVRARVTPI